MNKYTLILVFNGNRILMLNRFNSPAKGTWCGVGGHIENGETPTECAIRELEEETGLKIPELQYVGNIDIMVENSKNAESLNYIFVGYTSETIKTKTVEEGVLSLLPIKDVLDPENKGITQFTRKAILKALK